MSLEYDTTDLDEGEPLLNEPSENVDALLKRYCGIAYSIYAALFLYGSLLLFAGGFALTLEMTTSPQMAPSAAWVMGAAAAIALGHLVLEARSVKPRSVLRWCFFLFAVGTLASKPFFIQGLKPGTSLAICIVLSVGAALVGLARLVLVPYLNAVVALPVGVRMAMAALAWFWPVVILLLVRLWP